MRCASASVFITAIVGLITLQSSVSPPPAAPPAAPPPALPPTPSFCEGKLDTYTNDCDGQSGRETVCECNAYVTNIGDLSTYTFCDETQECAPDPDPGSGTGSGPTD